MEAPYKRRIIINDYNFNCNSSNEHNDNSSINHINRDKHSLISKKILKRNKKDSNIRIEIDGGTNELNNKNEDKKIRKIENNKEEENKEDKNEIKKK